MSGFSLIAKPGMKRFLIVPLIINLFIFIGLYFWLRHDTQVLNAWVMSFLPAWLQWLHYLVWFLFFICYFLIFIYFFTTIANLVAAPFNSMLSEKVETYLTDNRHVSRSLVENIQDVPRVIDRQLAVILYYLPRALCIFIFFFIPLLQMIAALLWFLWNAWFMTLTYVDYPADNHEQSFPDMRHYLTNMRWTSLGFGICVLVAMMIPGFNLIAMPAAVAGATRLWLETSSPKN